jgi:hypothetical protein
VVNEGEGGGKEREKLYLIGNNQNSVLVVLSKKDVCRLGVVLVYRDKIKIKIIKTSVSG